MATRAVTESTVPKQFAPYAFQPGQSGNPAGRPKGSRNKLAEAFVTELYEDFQEHGPSVIAAVREEKPDQYLKVIAAIIPKEFDVGERLGSILEDILERVDGRTRTIDLKPVG